MQLTLSVILYDFKHCMYVLFVFISGTMRFFRYGQVARAPSAAGGEGPQPESHDVSDRHRCQWYCREKSRSAADAVTSSFVSSARPSIVMTL
jgi:hypothetical protein